MVGQAPPYQTGWPTGKFSEEKEATDGAEKLKIKK